MRSKAIGTSLQNGMVLVLVALATSIVAYGDIMLEGAAMEPLGAARVLTSINGQVRTGFNVTRVHEERGMDMKYLEKGLEEMMNAKDPSERTIKNSPFTKEGFKVSDFPKWFQQLRDKTPELEMMDMVLKILTIYYQDSTEVARFLQTNEKSHEHYKRLLDHLLDQWIEKRLTPKVAFQRLRLHNNKVIEVFENPLMVTWETYVEKYVWNLKPSLSAPVEMLDVLRINDRNLPAMVKAMRHSVSTHGWNSPCRKLYVQQLINLCDDDPKTVARKLGLTVKGPFRDPVGDTSRAPVGEPFRDLVGDIFRDPVGNPSGPPSDPDLLYSFVNYLYEYISRVEDKNPTAKLVLEHFYKIFGYMNTVNLANLFRDWERQIFPRISSQ